MSHIDVKKKYLKRAHHLLVGRDGNRTNLGKLQASVEPIQSGKERKCKHSKDQFLGGEWNDSYSDSDSQSLASRRSSSSQLAPLPPPPDLQTSPAFEMKSVLSPSRLSPTLQHTQTYPRVPAVSLSSSVMQSRNHSTSGSLQQPTTTVSELQAQLRVQTDVNRELKRLLVASVSSDLQLRLQQIAQEKAELTQDLDLSLQQVVSNSEELDQITIECDIWRSKFIASRVMIDELANWKAELSLQLRESRKALQYLMHERKDLSRELEECSAHLQRALSELERGTPRHCPQCVGSNSAKIAAVSPIQYSSKATVIRETHSKTTVLDLAHGNTNAARELIPLLHRVTLGHYDAANVRSRTVPMEVEPSRVVEPTAGERLAQRVLSTRAESQRTREMSSSLPKLLLTDEDLIHHRSASAASRGSSLPPLSHRLFHFGAKALEDPFRIPFRCTKCKGKVMIV